jgi:GTP-binding protein
MKFLDQARSTSLRQRRRGIGDFRREVHRVRRTRRRRRRQGGDVILGMRRRANTLIDYRYSRSGETGHHGMGSQRTGGAGRMSCCACRAAQVFAEDNETLLVDLTQLGQRGLGQGRRQATSALQELDQPRAAPAPAKGWPGEERAVWLRLTDRRSAWWTPQRRQIDVPGRDLQHTAQDHELSLHHPCMGWAW